MDYPEFAKIVSLFLLSSVKLLFAPGASIAAGLTPKTTAFVSSAGGCSGVLFFYYFGHWLTERIRIFLARKSGQKANSNGGKGKKFTSRNRMIVKVKYHFGMVGLALLTPGIISIPIGAVVSSRLYWENRWMLPLLLLSTVLWSIGLTYLSVGVKHNLFIW